MDKISIVEKLQTLLEESINKITVEEIAKRIDHAVLTPWSTINDLEKALKETIDLGLRCIILSPPLIKQAKTRLKEEKENICLGAVAGFPYGYSSIEAKVKEVEDIISLGVNEVDAVINYQRFLLGEKQLVYNEAAALIEICKENGVTCKIIIETPVLPPQSIIELVQGILKTAKPDYIKTSTGYAPRKTAPEDVYLLNTIIRRLRLRTEVGIKAAGGIRTGLQALIMLSLGADIIGTSTPQNIIRDIENLKNSGLIHNIIH